MSTLARVTVTIVLGAALLSVSAGPTAASSSETEIAFLRSKGNGCAVHVIDADGRNVRRLTPWTLGCQSPPVWSPDGRRLAFYARAALWVMNADGTHRRRLSSAIAQDLGPGPSWAPDGKSLTFNRNPVTHRAESAVYTVRVDGGGLRRLTRERFAESPVWSPDGAHIAFTSDRTQDNGDLFVMHPDGSRQRRLTPNAGVEVSLAWSPDGSKLAFYADGGRIFTVGATRGAKRRLLTSWAATETVIAWAPEGRRIAFERDRDSDLTGSDITVMSSKGFSERPLTRRGYNFSPSWSPDGREIVFEHILRLEGPSPAGLAIVGADGHGLRMLTRSRRDEYSAWQPAGG